MAFAHRGASLDSVENSIDAFDAAYKIGFRNFELDVNASLDREVFVFHDENLKRLTGKNIQFNHLPAAELKRLLVYGKKEIPTLSEVVKKFPDAQFNIDAKSWSVAKPLCKFIDSAKIHDRICIGGFNDLRTKKIVRKLGMQVCHSFGPLGIGWFFLCYFLNVRRTFAAGCLQLPEKLLRYRLLSRRFVKFAHSCGLKVHIWTVNDEKIMKRLIDLGVDGIMTDDCEMLKEVLKSRGLWKSTNNRH